MTTSDIITRVYREAVASYGDGGVNRLEAEESALATLMVEVRAGRLDIDFEKALRHEIRKADESDGRSADGMIRRLAAGDSMLFLEDFDVIVTLGGGLRKPWGAIDPVADLDAMNEIRFRNFKAARSSFQEFNGNVTAVQMMCAGHETLIAAYDAGAFQSSQTTAGKDAA